MDTIALVENQVEDGARLINELPRLGVEVTAAFWLKRSDNPDWRLYIVSPGVDTEGARKAYSQLHPAFEALAQPVSIDPFDIKFIGPSNPIAKDALALLQQSPRTRPFPQRWGIIGLGNVGVEDVYLYPLPGAPSKTRHSPASAEKE